MEPLCRKVTETMRWARSLVIAACSMSMTPASAGDGDALQIVQFDFDGGGGTLFVTPDKRVLLVDSGWPAGQGPTPLSAEAARLAPGGSHAQRIVSELRKRGLKRIDYLVTTHYHLDHVGGLAELARLVPIGTFIDHGENREPIAPGLAFDQRARAAPHLYDQYRETIAGRARRIVRAGDRIRLGGLRIDITNADGEVLKRPMRGGGRPGLGCPAPLKKRKGGEENARSIGLVARYGKARIVLLGDTTSDVESRLVCPINRIGTVDLMFATHHGSAQSNDAVVYANLRPRVVVIGNGAVKGGDPAAFEAISAAVHMDGLWQMHETVKNGGRNGKAGQIANIAAGSDQSHSLEIAVQKDVTITVANPRNGNRKTYPDIPH